jgi:hypothetical protein
MVNNYLVHESRAQISAASKDVLIDGSVFYAAFLQIDKRGTDVLLREPSKKAGHMETLRRLGDFH